jgi:hypothetical protein
MARLILTPQRSARHYLVGIGPGGIAPGFGSTQHRRLQPGTFPQRPTNKRGVSSIAKTIPSSRANSNRARYSPGGETGAGSLMRPLPVSAAIISFPWNRPFSMKMSEVLRPPTTTPAR